MMYYPVPPPWLPEAEVKTGKPVVKSPLKGYFSRAGRILQGLFVLGIGIFLIVLNSGNPYKEVSGHIQDISAFSRDGEYYASYLQISTAPDNLFMFDRDALRPTWNGQFFKNERVDVYYSDNTPRRIGALQMYDLSGHPTTKFTTIDYIDSQNASPLSNAGLDIGVVLVLLGAGYLLCWVAIYGKEKFVRASN